MCFSALCTQHTTSFCVNQDLRFGQGQEGMYYILTFFFNRYVILLDGNTTRAIHPLLAFLSMCEHL